VHCTTTYFVGAHFTTSSWMGAFVMAFLIALHYWFRRCSGAYQKEGNEEAAELGSGSNETFLPQVPILGNAGMPRRYYMYPRSEFQALKVD